MAASCCAISRRASCSRATTRRPGLVLAGPAVSAARPAAAAATSSPTTSSRPRAAASTTAISASCPTAWGRKPFQKPVEDVVADIRQHGARKLIFVDLNLIADRAYAARLFEALIPLQRAVVRPGDRAAGRRSRSCSTLAARSGCHGLLMGLESISPANLRRLQQGLQLAGRSSRSVVERAARARHRAAGLLRLRPRRRHARRLPEDRASSRSRRGIDLPRFAIVTPFPNTALYKRLEREGRILTRNWELYDGQHVVFQPAQMSVQRAAARAPSAAWKHAYSRPVDRAAPASLARAVAGGARHQSRLPLLRPQPAPLLQLRLDHRPRPPTRRQPRPRRLDASRPASAARLVATMRLTLIHPCIGRQTGRALHPHLADGAAAAGDARRADAAPTSTCASTTIGWSTIPFDEPTDLVAISVETYTAKRAYQIATEYRRRGVPVVMGGFHADALPGRSRATTRRRSSSARPRRVWPR